MNHGLCKTDSVKNLSFSIIPVRLNLIKKDEKEHKYKLWYMKFRRHIVAVKLSNAKFQIKKQNKTNVLRLDFVMLHELSATTTTF